jgi:translation elongation factor EF-Ts
VHLIGEEMQSEVVLEAVQGMNELTAAQLGVVDKNTRERLVALVTQTLENTQVRRLSYIYIYIYIYI